MGCVVRAAGLLGFVALALVVEGCALGSGLRDGGTAALMDAPAPGTPGGLGWFDGMLYTVATAVAYGGVSAIRGYIRGKKEEK